LVVLLGLDLVLMLTTLHLDCAARARLTASRAPVSGVQ
jgi:hypothetical protein